MLSHVASLMNGVRYPFINTRQGNSLPRTLWKCVEKRSSGTESYRP
jgi:hypothetical protein